MDEIPSLQQICYEILAIYAGYIEEIDCMIPSEVYEVCSRTNIFGLANLESLFTSSTEISTLEIWQKAYEEKLKSDDSYITSLNVLIKGPDFYRHTMLCSLLRCELKSDSMDDEDLIKLLRLSASLKILEMNSLRRLSPELVFCGFSSLLHVSLKDSKLGPANAGVVRDLVLRNSCLQTLNLHNCCLGDAGAQLLSPALSVSVISSLNLCWNDLTFAAVEPLLSLVRAHSHLRIVDLSRNNIMRALKQAQILVKEIRKTKPIDIKVV
jgi:hypothetical protein